MSDTRGRSSGSGGGRGAEAGPRASPMVEAGPSRREGDRPGSAQGVGRRPERPASALPFRPRDEASTSGNLFAPPPEIHQRQLFLNTWLPPEAHTVADLDMANQHVELNIDEIDLLD
ncbi:hypothetical protein T484DRAFT_1796294 [Baffinella frigidus]|nr:hypothetical protein T484DRAFT_1796294 [Cryptophyta sp. CCMP2293]